MVRFVHMSDTHADTVAKLAAVGEFSGNNSIDAILHTGDLIEASVVLQNMGFISQQVLKEDPGFIKRLEDKTITEEDKKKLAAINQLEAKTIIGSFQQQYKRIEEVASRIKKKFPKLEIVGLPGNHDATKIAYDVVKTMRFVDREDVEIKGINIKGTPNVAEYPYGQLEQLFGGPLNAYHLGLDAGNDPQLQEMHKVEEQRLDSGKKAHLFMTHKELQDPVHGEKWIGTSTKNYLGKNKKIPVLSGHYHSDSIDYYKDHLFVRPSPDTFYVIDMDERTKKINWIDVYKLVKKSNHSAPKADMPELTEAIA